MDSPKMSKERASFRWNLVPVFIAFITVVGFGIVRISPKNFFSSILAPKPKFAKNASWDQTHFQNQTAWQSVDSLDKLLTNDESETPESSANGTDDKLALKAKEASLQLVSKELPLQSVSNEFLNKLSTYRFRYPLASPIEDSFPVDTSIIGRLQRGQLTEEEARLLRGKRVVFIGDSLDGNLLLNLILTCPRSGPNHSMRLKKPSFVNITCDYLSGNDKMYETFDVMVRGRFNLYDFEFVLHRAAYGVDPSVTFPGAIHPAFVKGRVKPWMSLKEMYTAILDESLIHLPDRRRADVVLFNLHLWVRYRERLQRAMYPEDQVERALKAYYEAAKDFFNPNAMAFHTIPGVDRRGWEVTHLDKYTRKVANDVGAGLFDWRKLTDNMYGKGMMKDKKHPGVQLNARFGAMTMAWLFEIFKSV